MWIDFQIALQRYLRGGRLFLQVLRAAQQQPAFGKPRVFAEQLINEGQRRIDLSGQEILLSAIANAARIISPEQHLLREWIRPWNIGWQRRRLARCELRG